MTERKIIVSVAASADGFIARSDGSVDWLELPRMAGDHGMGEFFKNIDTILWGRKTYETGLRLSKSGKDLGFGPKIKNYVFTHNAPDGKSRGVEFVNEPVDTFAKRLRASPGKDIWIMGGAELTASFLDAGEIDEFIINVIPILIGEGIPLVSPHRRTVELSLFSAHPYEDGVVKMHYGVSKKRPG